MLFGGDELGEIGCYVIAFFALLGAVVTAGALIFSWITVANRLLG